MNNDETDGIIKPSNVEIRVNQEVERIVKMFDGQVQFNDKVIEYLHDQRYTLYSFLVACASNDDNKAAEFRNMGFLDDQVEFFVNFEWTEGLNETLLKLGLSDISVHEINHIFRSEGRRVIQQKTLRAFLSDTVLFPAKWDDLEADKEYSSGVTISVSSLEPFQLCKWNEFHDEAMAYSPSSGFYVDELKQTTYPIFSSENQTRVQLYSHILWPIIPILQRLHRDQSISIAPTSHSNNSDADHNIIRGELITCPMETKPLRVSSRTVQTETVNSAEEYIRIYEQQKTNVQASSDIYWATVQIFGYMVEKASTKFGILTTYNTWWYYKFDPTSLTLHVSNPYRITEPGSLKALFYIIDLSFKPENHNLYNTYKYLERSVQVIYEEPPAGSQTSSMFQMKSFTGEMITPLMKQHQGQTRTMCLGSYRETLGHGAVGHTFRYVDFILHGVKYDEIAVKTADDPESRIGKVLNELAVYRQLSSIQGQIIPRMLGVYLAGSRLIFCMSLIHGRCLEDDDFENQELVHKIRDRVKRLHTYKVLHNDLRLNNILIDQNNDPWIIDMDKATIHQEMTVEELDKNDYFHL